MKIKKAIGVILFLIFVMLPTFALGEISAGGYGGQVNVGGSNSLLAKGVGLLSDVAAKAVGSVVWVVLWIVGKIGSVLLSFGSEYVRLMFQLNGSVTTMPVVNVGWKLTRDLANLGFVLAIIVIGFATIVRYEQYGAKKLLPRLIAAAIVINFSLTIAGFFLDFSNVLTQFFIDHSSSGQASMMDNIANSFGVQKFLDVDQKAVANTQSNTALESLGDFGAAFASNLASLFFVTTFTLLAALTFIGMGLMLAVRFVWIAVLLIMAPLAWLFWVIPALGGEFGKWWKNFLRWTFFPPILSFFLYLTIISQNGLDSFETAVLGSNTGGTFIKSFMTTASNMLIVIALLVGGLITAQNMGMTGANGMLGIAKGVGNKVKGWAAGAAVGGTVGVGARLGRSALTLGTDEKGKTWLERQSAKLSSGNTAFARFAKPFIGAPLTGLAGLSAKAKAAKAKGMEEAQKKYENRTGEDVANDMNRKVTQGFLTRDEDLAAAGIKIAKEGKWDNLNDAVKEQMIGAVRKTGSKDKILGYVPHLADKFGMTTDQAFAKYVTDASKLSKEVLSKPEVARALRPSHINQVGALADEDKKDGMKTNIENEINSETVAINGVNRQALDAIREMRVNLDAQLKAIEDLKTSRAGQNQIAAALGTRDAMKQQLRDTIDNLNDDNKVNLRVLDSMAQNLSWQDEFKREDRIMPSI